MPDQLLKVLIVDDDPLGRQLLTRSLETGGFDVIECRDGVEALQILEDSGPALLVLDYQMPEFNGAQVCELIRTSKNPEIAQIPIILVTAHSGEDHEIECLHAGADDFVTKPVNLAVLRARIDTHLRLHAMRKQLQQQKTELEQWRQSHELDLDNAQRTQHALLPTRPPNIAGWKVAARYRPLIQVGGDMYDYRPLQDGSSLVWIADATGHGASGALLTTLAKLLFRHAVTEHASAAAIVQSVNRDLFGVFKGRSHMSVGCVTLTAGSGDAAWCGAGHPPLILLGGGGTIEFVASGGPPIGLQREMEIQETPVSLAPGDAFLMYTDGLYGIDGATKPKLIEEELRDLVDGPVRRPESYLEDLLIRVKARSSEGAFTDDVTAIVALWTGSTGD